MVLTPAAKLRLKLQEACARELPRVSWAEVARRMDRPYHTVIYWSKTGNIPAEALGDLSEALGVEMDYWRI